MRGSFLSAEKTALEKLQIKCKKYSLEESIVYIYQAIVDV